MTRRDEVNMHGKNRKKSNFKQIIEDGEAWGHSKWDDPGMDEKV